MDIGLNGARIDVSGWANGKIPAPIAYNRNHVVLIQWQRAQGIHTGACMMDVGIVIIPKFAQGTM